MGWAVGGAWDPAHAAYVYPRVLLILSSGCSTFLLWRIAARTPYYDLVDSPQFMMRSFTVWLLGDRWTGLPSVLTRLYIMAGVIFRRRVILYCRERGLALHPQSPELWFPLRLATNLSSISSNHWELPHRGVCRPTWPKWSPWTWNRVLSRIGSHTNLAVLPIPEYKNCSSNQKNTYAFKFSSMFDKHDSEGGWNL